IILEDKTIAVKSRHILKDKLVLDKFVKYKPIKCGSSEIFIKDKLVIDENKKISDSKTIKDKTLKYRNMRISKI
ncbi:26996_t:CDS:1, partial [Racocetra persica]